MSDASRKPHPMARLSLGCLLTKADIEKPSMEERVEKLEKQMAELLWKLERFGDRA